MCVCVRERVCVYVLIDHPSHYMPLALVLPRDIKGSIILFITNTSDLCVYVYVYMYVHAYMCVRKFVCVYVYMRVLSSHLLWTSDFLDVPTGVTQEEGHTGFLIHLPPAMLALIFIARRIQSFLSLVDREVEFRVLTN